MWRKITWKWPANTPGSWRKKKLICILIKELHHRDCSDRWHCSQSCTNTVVQLRLCLTSTVRVGTPDYAGSNKDRIMLIRRQVCLRTQSSQGGGCYRAVTSLVIRFSNDSQWPGAVFRPFVSLYSRSLLGVTVVLLVTLYYTEYHPSPLLNITAKGCGEDWNQFQVSLSVTTTLTTVAATRQIISARQYLWLFGNKI